MNKFGLYSAPKAGATGNLPFDPFVALVVGSHVAAEGEIILTPNLMTESEIDYEVNSLMRELEEFRILAKKKLKSLQVR